MTPERWQKVRDVLHEALQLAPEQRSGFLDRVCQADDPLRSDVESLLRSSDNLESSFLESPGIHLMLKRGTRLGDYEVEALLGFGGMGEVYRARDLRLHRNVAIKVLHSFVSLDPDRLHRFEQEARAAAALNHPNIIAVFQLGSYQGSPYLVSELLEGLTLRAHLRHGPLELDKAIDYCSQIADGLAAAHSKGIVHRDLKPENLILTPEERVKILDFGLAKLIALPIKAATLDIATDPGTVMGTLGYMSPEQALGKNLDLRTDLFSLGAVLYEMVTGRRAFEGDSSAAVYDAILNRMPPSPRQQNPELPAQIENIVFKAIEKNRDLRYQVASEIRADLKRLKRDRESHNIASTSASADLERRGTAKDTTPALVQRRYQRRIAWMVSALALALVIGAVGRSLMKSRGQRARPPWRPTTIAVLPFQNAAHDPKLDYLGTALPDEVITTLSYAPTLSVRPFSSSQQFSSQNSDPHQAGRQLQVSDVVTGHYLQRSDRLSVTLEAMDIVKDEMVWRASVEVGMNDMLGLREQLTSALQKGLLPSLGASGNELSTTKPKSQEAYELYLRSQDSAYWTVARNKDGIALLERSLALDPGYAPAWLALGAHYYDEADMVTGDQEAFRKCIAAFERAHQLDPNLLSASTWLIGTRRVYGDLAVSFMQVQELAERRPRRAEVHLLFAQLLRSAGALEQAAHECEITRQLDPDLWTDCFVLYIYMADFVKARHEMDRSPGEFSSFILGHVLLREGKIEEAMPRLRILAPDGYSNYNTIRDCSPDSSTKKCEAAAERSVRGFLKLPDPDAWYFGAALLAFLGRSDASIRLLDADIKHSFCFYPAVDHDPLFDKIRQSAEFKAARQAGIECQKKFAPYVRIQIQ